MCWLTFEDKRYGRIQINNVHIKVQYNASTENIFRQLRVCEYVILVFAYSSEIDTDMYTYI